MAAYAALSMLDGVIATVLEYAPTVFSDKPVLVEILESVHKKIKSFEVFMDRLDLSSRIRLKASLLRVQEAADQFVEALDSYDGTLEELDVTSDEYLRAQQASKEDSDSFIDALERMEEVYLKQHTHLPHHQLLPSKSKMVGLSDVYTKLKKDIIGGWTQQLIFSLVGMAGIGKTALANKLFEDLDILEWFDCCTWVTIGREYQPEDIIQDILAQLGVDEHEMLTEGFLCDYLRGKRCFIVLDDVWDMKLVERCFDIFSSNTKSGSRVLVTTRIRHQYSFSDHLINVRLLNKQESLNLLCDKIFAQSFCPPEYEKAIKLIAEKCDGLPLTIVTVADLLSRTPRSEWVDVATRKKHQVFTCAYHQISKMANNEVILVHCGYWHGLEYKNGEEGLIYASLHTICYAKFLDEIHYIVRADRRTCDYALHCFMPTKISGEVKFKIKTDDDLRRVADVYDYPKLFVSIEPKDHDLNIPFSYASQGVVFFNL